MTIFNVRSGFACNSSSTHSIVMVPKGRPTPAPVPSESSSFGWDDFTLTDVASKTRYMAALVFGVGRYGPEALPLLREVFGLSPEDIATQTETGAWDFDTVDHQSDFKLPTNGGRIDVEFLKDCLRFIQRPDVVILGGNDNSSGHPLSDELDQEALAWTELTRGWATFSPKARKDPQGFWAIFYKHNGTKVRGSFDDTLKDPGYSMRPELVDLKITDQCGAGCSYCYQGSTPKGQHASLDGILHVLDQLGVMGVFEVAIGGGEPLEHPDFWKIIDACVERDMVPNFTTRRPDLLDHSYGSRVGAVAFSTQTPKEVERIAKLLPEDRVRSIWGPPSDDWRVVHQHVVGMETRKQYGEYLKSLLDHGVDTLTLLGFKNQQRGSLIRSVDASWAIDEALASAKSLALGVDTKFAQDYPEAMKGINPKLYYLSEGAHSMYVDAVTRRVGPSSYHPEYMTDYESRFGALEEAFRALPTRMVRGEPVEFGRREHRKAV